MVRVLKEPEVRKAEIMDTAKELFYTKGFEATTTNDILEKAKIARGTLYYYFKSKEDIMDAVLERELNKQIDELMPIVNDNNLNAMEKIRQIFLHQSNRQASEKILEYLHQPENSAMHQKSLVLSVRNFAPVIAEIIRQGIAEKLFHNDYPLELTQFLLVGLDFLLDQSIFAWSPEELNIRMKSLADIMETALRAEKGSFSFLTASVQAKGAKER